eukprot:scaffold2630_cov195-Chaetoceros_neogracile.AAC.3
MLTPLALILFANSNFMLQEMSMDQTMSRKSIATGKASGYGIDNDSIMSITSKPTNVRFWVVDLAGIERSKRTGAFIRFTRQKEASLINLSLMNLSACLRALKQNQSSNSS